MIVFFIIASLFLGLLHVVVYEAAITIFSVHSIAMLWVLRIALTVLAASFIAGSAMSHSYDNAFVRAFYRVSAVWLGFVVYLFLVSVIYGLSVAIVGLFMPGSQLAAWGIILICAAAAVTLYGLVHARHIVRTDIACSLRDLPPPWKGRTIVVMSDIHLGHVRGRAFAAELVALSNSLHPDAIFIVGDLYDGVQVAAADIIAPLKELYAPLGIFFVTGNHEEFGDSGPYLRAIEGVGIHVLMNECVDLDGVLLVGVDDRDSTDKTKFTEILARLVGSDPDRNTPSILLKHQPEQLAAAEKAGISLQISGHTHQAQMFPLSLITRWIYHGYDYGLHRFGFMQVYTSSGAGTWGPPLRVGTKAEMVRIRFE